MKHTRIISRLHCGKRRLCWMCSRAIFANQKGTFDEGRFAPCDENGGCDCSFKGRSERQSYYWDDGCNRFMVPF